jgi:glutaredoxin
MMCIVLGLNSGNFKRMVLEAPLGMFVTCRSVTLYVKSKKVITGKTSVTEPHLIKKGVRSGDAFRMRDMFWDTAFDNKVEEVHDYVLPDDQKATAETVRRLCEKHGFELRIIDVTRENILHRAMQEEVSKIKTFPTLITDSERRVEGSFLEEQLESLLSKG